LKEANEFFDKFQGNMLNGINTCLIGQIENFDAAELRADVVLLPDQDLIINVPVGIPQTSDFYIRMPYQPGDFVLVLFAQRDLDGILYGGDATPSQRQFSLDDAVVICGINLFIEDPLPSTNANDLVIGKKNNNVNIVMRSDNDDIEVKCNQFKVNGRAL
jgi:hypothetical protein